MEMIASLEELCFSDSWTKEMIREDMANPLCTYLLGEIDEELVAYIGFWLVVGECQINNVAVSPFYRREGIGTRLLMGTFALCKALGADKANLEVRAGNHEAIALYKSMGFKEDGIRKGYYENDGEDALLMSMDL